MCSVARFSPNRHLPKAGDRPSPCKAAPGELMRCREGYQIAEVHFGEVLD